MTDSLTIVAVHGNGGGSSRFDRMAHHLPDDVHLVAVDLPGFGDRPADPSLRSVADYADHLAEELAACDAPAVLLGHGIGGSIALDLAARHPEAMAALILHAPVGADLDTRLFPRIMSTPAVRRTVKAAIAARPLRPLWTRLFFPTGVPEPHRSAFFEGYRRCEAFGQMFEVIDADWFTALPPVSGLPVTLLWGEHDRVLRQGQTDAIRSKVPDAAVRIVAGWDHFPMLEQPEEYVDVVVELARAALPV